jgi:hypothetical protein
LVKLSKSSRFWALAQVQRKVNRSKVRKYGRILRVLVLSWKDRYYTSDARRSRRDAESNRKLGYRDGLIDAYRLSINPSLDEVPFQGTSSSSFALNGYFI